MPRTRALSLPCAAPSPSPSLSPSPSPSPPTLALARRTGAQVREGLETCRLEYEAAKGEEHRMWREELGAAKEVLARDITRLHKEHGAALRE